MTKTLYKNLPVGDTFKLSDRENDKRVFVKTHGGALEITNIWGKDVEDKGYWFFPNESDYVFAGNNER